MVDVLKALVTGVPAAGVHVMELMVLLSADAPVMGMVHVGLLAALDPVFARPAVVMLASAEMDSKAQLSGPVTVHVEEGVALEAAVQV